MTISPQNPELKSKLLKHHFVSKDKPSTKTKQSLPKHLSTAKTGNMSWVKPKDSSFKIILSKHGFQKFTVIKIFIFYKKDNNRSIRKIIIGSMYVNYNYRKI